MGRYVDEKKNRNQPSLRLLPQTGLTFSLHGALYQYFALYVLKSNTTQVGPIRVRKTTWTVHTCRNRLFLNYRYEWCYKISHWSCTSGSFCCEWNRPLKIHKPQRFPRIFFRHLLMFQTNIVLHSSSLIAHLNLTIHLSLVVHLSLLALLSR